ncbi:MAG: YicC family protein [Muribaculaceae bacterium]|nr:YicC family protein [Muribaculaceae bacterium]
MISSMTGYGKVTVANDKKQFTIEIKSINSKQLDLIIRMPSIFRDQENNLRNRLSSAIERGKVDFTVSVVNIEGGSDFIINTGVLQNYKNQLTDIIQELRLEAPKDWLPILLRLPDVMSTSDKDATSEEKIILENACSQALENFNISRLKEGRKLYEFFFNKTERIRFLLQEIEKYESARIPKIREKLESQLQKLTGVEYDKGRLEQELIYYIEKLDVTEEKVRLKSHIDYFEETLGEPDSSEVSGKGKKLGFISQEMGREINTLGSKANDADMQKIVVMMKDELEQIKEQIYNVL